MQIDTRVDAAWLTDCAVPAARPVWATRKSRFRIKKARAWIAQETTMWWDVRNDVIYYGESGQLTDFASTPVGDGHKGVMRGAGRLHDLMEDNTPVLTTTDPQAKHKLLGVMRAVEKLGGPVTLGHALLCGYTRDRKHLSIWAAGQLYYRMLCSGGMSRWRAAAQRVGLRGLGVQHLYRWAWNDNPWQYHSDATP